MKPTISKLWNGNLAPWEEIGEHNKELIHLSRNCEKYKTALLETLDEKDKKIFEEYENAVNDWQFFETEDAFIKGFSIGMTLAAETIISK